MKIKNQERIMTAVKRLLAAENALAVVHAEKVLARDTKKIRDARYKRLDAAENELIESRADLRKIHTEIVHDEFGPYA